MRWHLWKREEEERSRMLFIYYMHAGTQEHYISGINTLGMKLFGVVHAISEF